MQHKLMARRCDIDWVPSSRDAPAVSLSGRFVLNGETEIDGAVRFEVLGAGEDARPAIFPTGGPNDTPLVHVKMDAAKRAELAQALLADVGAGSVQVTLSTQSPILLTSQSGTILDAIRVAITRTYG